MIPRPSPSIRSRAVGLGGLLVLLLCAVAAVPPRSEAAPAGGRVVVVGFDGADARTTERMMDEGRLPNLARLREGGTFAPLVSSNPAESAAGWAALNTGTNPLKNNVPSFIKRDPGGVMPTFGHIGQETVQVADLEHRGFLKYLVAYGPTTLSVATGVGAFVGFLVIFRLLLRVHLAVALVLSAALGGAGSWAVHRSGGSVPEEVPDVYYNLVAQPGFWDLAAAGGKRAVVLDAALAFGRPETPGARVLSGLGLPDIRGAGNGDWFLYTTDDLEMYRTPKGQKSKGSGTGTTFRVDERDGKVSTEVYGPVNWVERDRLMREIEALSEKLNDTKLGWKEGGELRDRRKELERSLGEMGWTPSGGRSPSNVNQEDLHRVSLPMELERRGDRLAITIAGQTHEAGESEWTDWFRLPFELSPLVTAHGITRARVMSLEDPLTVYLHSFDIDPENPPFWQPVSTPADFSAELADWIGGPYETLGWACMTNELKDGALPVEVFLEDIEFTLRWRERLTLAALERDDWDLLFSVFSTTDRLQHMMYKFHDPLHPQHDAEEAAREVSFFGEPTALKDAIPAIYEQMDRVVGEVVSRLGPDDTLLLCADHGFTSYRRGLEVNNWLVANGYMTLEDGLTSTGSPTNYLLACVDWSGTKAYSLGLGMVYVNMEGREPDGVVPRDDAKALLREMGDKLLELRDPGPEDAPYDEPVPVVRDYAIMDDLYDGPGTWGDPEWPCADLMIGFEEYYRAAWGTVSGKVNLDRNDDGDVVAGEMLRDNTNPWSGDHASNSPHLVTGIFFSNRPVALPEDGVSVMHLAPTVLDRLGVPIPGHLDLPPLASR